MSYFTFGTFLFRLVRRFAMDSVWVDFVRSHPARDRSLYGGAEINRKENFET
jgi:hypothetical protein